MKTPQYELNLKLHSNRTSESQFKYYQKCYQFCIDNKLIEEGGAFRPRSLGDVRRCIRALLTIIKKHKLDDEFFAGREIVEV